MASADLESDHLGHWIWKWETGEGHDHVGENSILGQRRGVSG